MSNERKGLGSRFWVFVRCSLFVVFSIGTLNSKPKNQKPKTKIELC